MALNKEICQNCRRREVPTIELTVEPGGETRVIPRAKTARQLLEKLQILEETALVIRQGQLLTPDRQIWPNDAILIRLVGSRG